MVSHILSHYFFSLDEVDETTNDKEASRLKSSKHRQRLAQGLANGIHAYARSLLGK